MTENDFIVTITKVLPEINKKGSPIYLKKKPKIKRKINNINSSQLIYKFNTFDDYCNFIEFLLNHSLSDANKIAKEVCVYLYKEMDDIMPADEELKARFMKEIYPLYKDLENVDILVENTDFGVG